MTQTDQSTNNYQVTIYFYLNIPITKNIKIIIIKLFYIEVWLISKYILFLNFGFFFQQYRRVKNNSYNKKNQPVLILE